MKKLQSALLIAVIACALLSFDKGGNKVSFKAAAKQHIAITELTKHEWTIAEYKETINDTPRNVTLAMAPCEKGQVLKYDPDNTYKITEGVNKCISGQDIKAQGKWNYAEADNEISEQFSGGATIYKKILSLDEGLLKIQYEGEARKIITITYLSELGKKDDAKKDQYIDNSDPVSIITQMMRENINEQGKYVLVSLNDFMKGVQGTSGPLKRVVVVPLTDMTDPNRTVDFNDITNKLFAQGKAANMDYILTGKLISLKKERTSEDKAYTRIKYNIIVLSMKKEKEVKNESFAFPEEARQDRAGAILRGINNAVRYVPFIPYVPYYYGPGYYWAGNSSRALSSLYYGGYYAKQAASNYNGAYSVYSSNVSANDRKAYVESSLSVIQAIESTQPDQKKFLEKKFD